MAGSAPRSTRRAQRSPAHPHHRARVLIEQTAKDARDAKGARTPSVSIAQVRVVPSEARLSPRAKLVCRPERSSFVIPSGARLSSRAAARDLLYGTRGRASYRAVRVDPSLPLGMTSLTER